MQFSEGGGRPHEPVPDLREMLDRFARPVAVAATPPGLGPGGFEFETINDQPWAIIVTYASSAQGTLILKTLRSGGAADGHGAPVESLAEALISLHLQRPTWRLPDPEEVGHEGVETALLQRRDALLRIRAELVSAPTRSATVVIDELSVQGRRIDHGYGSAVELPWNGQVVFCAGRADTVDALALRTMGSQNLPQ